MNNRIFSNIQSDDLFLRFTNGEESGLAHLYSILHKPLLRHGLRIVRDEFVVKSSIQEAWLKAWAFRNRLTSMLHTYRFLRLNVTWKCYNHYRQSDKRHHRLIYTDNMDRYTGTCYLAEQEDNNQSFVPHEEMLQSIYQVIPYLTPNRQTILTLYFKYGFSFKQIAKRFSTSNQAVSIELQKGLEHLKKIIHAKKKLEVQANTPKNGLLYNEILDGELLQLFKLRYELKLGFDVIASKMNLPQAYVQQQYVAAHTRIQQMAKKNK